MKRWQRPQGELIYVTHANFLTIFLLKHSVANKPTKKRFSCIIVAAEKIGLTYTLKSEPSTTAGFYKALVVVQGTFSLKFARNFPEREKIFFGYHLNEIFFWLKRTLIQSFSGLSRHTEWQYVGTILHWKMNVFVKLVNITGKIRSVSLFTFLLH